MSKYLSIVFCFFMLSTVSGQTDVTVLSYTDSNSYLHLMNSNGTYIGQIAEFRIGTHSWSPDGTQIVFASVGAESDIFILDMETLEQTQITFSEYGSFVENTNPVWSPDGTMIAYTSNQDGNWELYLIILETMEQYRLTENNVADGFNGLTWTPESDGIAFVRDGEIYFDEENQTYEEQQIYLVTIPEPDTEVIEFNLTQNVHLCDTGEFYHNPHWSVTTNQLVFASGCGGDDMDIYVMDMSGEDTVENPSLINVTNGRVEYQAGYRGIGWNESGTQIAFVALVRDETDSSELFVLDFDSNADEYPIQRLTESPTNTIFRDVDWRPILQPQS